MSAVCTAVRYTAYTVPMARLSSEFARAVHDLVREVRARVPSLQAAYLFGSVVSGDARPDSDIDLALLLPPAESVAIGSLAMSDLRFDLESIAGRPVDLINLRRVSTVFQHRIVATGQPVAVADRRALAEFEMLTMSLYQKLNEERADILADIAATGTVYQP